MAERSQTLSKPNRKRPSPFRIKVGSVVALRMQATGNSVSIVDKDAAIHPVDFSNFSYVWTAPFPGRDEGLALLGKCIRLFLPKVTAVQKRRVLEGQVVGVHHAKPTKIHLLVDKAHADAFPFINRVPDSTIDLSSASKSAKRNAMLEERIRGKDKVLLQVKLRPPCSAPTLENETSNSIQWAMLKLVPNKLCRDKAEHIDKSSLSDSTKQTTLVAPPKLTMKYVGNGIDPTEQQAANWRWLASRYHDRLFAQRRNHAPFVTRADAPEASTLAASKEDLAIYAQILSAGLVGVVKEIDIATRSDNSLASVRLERLVLPQQTSTVRKKPLHAYQDFDHEARILQVPIEQLVVVARSLEQQETMASLRGQSPPENPYLLDQLVISASYSLQQDSYHEIASKEHDNIDQQLNFVCHRCRQATDDTSPCPSSNCMFRGRQEHCSTFWCTSCVSCLCPGPKLDENQLFCRLKSCDCQWCLSFAGSSLQDELFAAVATARQAKAGKLKRGTETTLALPMMTVKAIPMVDFGLPKSLLDVDSHPKPLAHPSSRVRPSTPKRPIRIYADPHTTGRSKRTNASDKSTKRSTVSEDYTSFQPTCARQNDFEALRSLRTATKQGHFISADRGPSMDLPRNMREFLKEQKRKLPAEAEDKPTASGRAARANQRRLLKDVSFFSMNVDTLATREPQIRFDRSSIHAWGVFADEDIAADEMIIEYKGVLISNAVAEKREKLYEQEKIGSDYMFRIDSSSVIDATKEGNVARFINASCDPNCYTKIITIDGSKRIVIYAKRAISAGEELSYDYKFQMEFDPAKRIPCHCGSKDCRGFMNWDKRFVAVEATEERQSDASVNDYDAFSKGDQSLGDSASCYSSRTTNEDGFADERSMTSSHMSMSDGDSFTGREESVVARTQVDIAAAVFGMSKDENDLSHPGMSQIYVNTVGSSDHSRIHEDGNDALMYSRGRVKRSFDESDGSSDRSSASLPSSSPTGDERSLQVVIKPMQASPAKRIKLCPESH